MNDDKDTAAKLADIKDIITDRLHAALTDPKKPPRASLISAAITWARLTGAIEDPDARFRPRPIDPALAGQLPFLTPAEKEERDKLAAAVQHAVESLDDDEDHDTDGDEDF